VAIHKITKIHFVNKCAHVTIFLTEKQQMALVECHGAWSSEWGYCGKIKIRKFCLEDDNYQNDFFTCNQQTVHKRDKP
jgi:hypothetical protein